VTTSGQTITVNINSSANTLLPDTYVGEFDFNSTDGIQRNIPFSATPTVLPRPNTYDFNGDGYSDIAWRDTGVDNAMWLMNGGTILSSAGLGTIATAWSVVGQRDFNGDGMADLLWHDTSGDIAI